MLDVGGESTRPGRDAEVPADEEIRRVVPVVEGLVREFPAIPVSVDTMKASVADVALQAGAGVINDVSASRLDSSMASVVARHRAGLVLMHSRGSNLRISSYDDVDYGTDLLGTIIAELRAAIVNAERGGVAADAIVVDPGLGFSKTPAQSLQALDQLGALACLGRPIYVGPSRKRFLGEVSGRPVTERDELTAVACALAVERGAHILRTHDVGRARDAVALAVALQEPTRG
jgi:dihydropteroate synthase